MKKINTYFWMLGFVLVAMTSQAQNKIGYFDINYVLPLMPEYKQAEANMDTYGKQVEQELKSKKNEFETKYKAYMDAAQKGELTEAIAQAKQAELQSLDRQYQEFQQTISQSVQERRTKLLAPIYEKIEKIIGEVAPANGYASIMRSESCYVPVKANNISDLVLKKMNITPPPPSTNKTN
jgi:outer membrane protein